MSKELPEFASEKTLEEHSFEEVTLDSLVAVYAIADASPESEQSLVTCGRVVAVPETRPHESELRSVGRYLLIAPLGDDGKPEHHDFSDSVTVNKLFLPPRPDRNTYPKFRFFELKEERAQAQG